MILLEKIMRQKMLSEALRERFGTKVYKLSLSSGCTCPNRDGTIGVGGCTFCSEGGSGEFAAPLLPVDEQIRHARARVDGKFPARIPLSERKYIAYFQSFTNTYGEPERLKALYMEAISRPEIAALSIGTRPDCFPEEIVEMLADLNRIKPVWVELGLPGESREDMLETVRYLSRMKPRPDGIKLQQLQILRGTRLAEQFEREPFPVMELEEYCALIRDCLEILPDDIVIHRLTGDGPKKLLIAPKWSADKKRVLNTLRKWI